MHAAADAVGCGAVSVHIDQAGVVSVDGACADVFNARRLVLSDRSASSIVKHLVVSLS